MENNRDAISLVVRVVRTKSAFEIPFWKPVEKQSRSKHNRQSLEF